MRDRLIDQEPTPVVNAAAVKSPLGPWPVPEGLRHPVAIRWKVRHPLPQQGSAEPYAAPSPTL